jgi:hypothetical protein
VQQALERAGRWAAEEILVQRARLAALPILVEVPSRTGDMAARLTTQRLLDAAALARAAAAAAMETEAPLVQVAAVRVVAHSKRRPATFRQRRLLVLRFHRRLLLLGRPEARGGLAALAVVDMEPAAAAEAVMEAVVVQDRRAVAAALVV